MIPPSIYPCVLLPVVLCCTLIFFFIFSCGFCFLIHLCCSCILSLKALPGHGLPAATPPGQAAPTSPCIHGTAFSTLIAVPCGTPLRIPWAYMSRSGLVGLLADSPGRRLQVRATLRAAHRLSSTRTRGRAGRGAMTSQQGVLPPLGSPGP